MDLKTAVGLSAGELVAFVGAGGKTTTVWRLLRLLVDSGKRVIFTTTTHIFRPQEMPLLLSPHPGAAEIARRLAELPILVLAAGRGESGDPTHAARSPYPADPVKLVGLKPEVLSDLARRLPDVTWLVEADGARGRLLKAPTAHEPVIPSGADRVIIVAGLNAIGEPLDERTVHRPEIAAHLLGVPLGAVITPDLFARLIGHPAGGLKGAASDVETVVLLTQWSGEGCPHVHAAAVARQLLPGCRVARVVLADLRAPDPVLKVWTEQPPTRRLANSLTCLRRRND